MKRIWWIVTIAVILLVGGSVLYFSRTPGSNTTTNVSNKNDTREKKDSAAIAAGKQLSNNNCESEGPGTLTQLPMNETDYSMILPYGLVTGGHVTPIDHQYFSPTVFRSPRDTYPVYAMADSKIVEISPRTNEGGTEYRFVFSMSCTFLYYYDLVTSLAPDIKREYDKNLKGYKAVLDLEVKAGQLVGKIGGQTLDFAVWDTTKPLKNFTNPKSYEGEAWKIYTSDPLDYYSADAKTKALAKYIRTTAPLSGRIDYDIEGKLIGSWFKTGTKGYSGETGATGQFSYWVGHLSIAPDYIDNSATIVSFGTWDGGEAKQFVAENPIDPATIGTASGLTKYELYGWRYSKSDGQMWDNMKLAHDLKVKVNENEFRGCVLFQLNEPRALKMEQFPNQKCAAVTSFSGKEITYER